MKKLLALVLALVMCLSLAACSKGGDTATDGSNASGGEEMDFMIVGTAADTYVPGYEKVISDFNETNEYGVTINVEFISNSDYKTKLTTLMASDSEPDIIFTWELGYLENFVNGGKIVSLQSYLDADPEWAESFNDGMLDQLTYDGEVYAIPTQETAAVMYYNKAIFEEYGLSVPTTYDEYRNVCDTLLANGVTPVALASTPDDAWLVSQYIQQLSNGIAGYELFESLKNGEGAWNDPAFIEAAGLFYEEVQAGYYEEGFTGVGADEARALFQNGQTAMYFNGCWENGNLDNESACAVYEDVSCFAMPAVKSEYANISLGSVDTSFAITKNCTNVDAAVAFLKFWTAPEQASMLLYEYGRIPSTNIELDESKLTSLTTDAINVFTEQVALTPWFDRVDTNIGNEFNNICVAVSNGDDIQTLFDSLQEYAQSNS